MTKLAVIRASAAVVTTLGFAGSAIGAAGASPHHYYDFGHSHVTNIGNGNVNNSNSVATGASTTQYASTGTATVMGGWWHYSGGNSATTGSAANTASTGTSVTVTNPVITPPALPSSHMGSQFNLNNNNVTNENQVMVDNTTSQTAVSGNASVYGSTGGSKAVSGNASNTSTESTTVTVN